MSDEPTVFVVDDDPAARRSVNALAFSMGVASKSYASAEEFLDDYQPDQPGCLVTDVKMLGMSGIELQKVLRQRHVRIPVIIITAFANTQLTVRAMQEGAVTLLEKPCHDQELWDAIRQALAKDATQRQQEQQLQQIRSRLDSLTPQERQVLDSVVAGKPNKIIAKELDVSIRTVEARRHHVFDKMQTDSVAELVRMVLLVEPPPSPGQTPPDDRPS